jgi:hypothetical protein
MLTGPLAGVQCHRVIVHREQAHSHKGVMSYTKLVLLKIPVGASLLAKGPADSAQIQL